jgi:multicomponent Na+:H+ antiporter subunit B
MDNTILKSISRILFPFIVIYGLYVTFRGHLSPGGGFAGGTIIASGFILRSLAFGTGDKIEVMADTILKKAESFSMLWFVILGLLGIVFSRNFLTNFANPSLMGKPGALFSGGLIIFINLGISIKVAATIVSIFYSLEGGE